jgi:nucleotide-binding universal stress UspA family protein
MQSLKNILYFADGRFGSTRALQRAIALARRSGAKLSLMDVTVESGIGAELVKRYGLDDDIQQCEQRFAALDRLASDWPSDLEPPRLRVTIGHPFIEVIQTVLRDGHDLVIKPARPRPGEARLFDSADMHLLRKCPCPVWIDRDTQDREAAQLSGAPPRCRRIVAAVDPVQPESKAISARILDAAVALAEQDAAELHLLHAWQPPAASPALTQAIEQIEREYSDALETLSAITARNGVACKGHLLRGRPADEISARARALDADLLVMSTLSRPREPGLFIGTMAEDLLQQTTLSVLALKPEGFVSPVTLANDGHRPRRSRVPSVP